MPIRMQIAVNSLDNSMRIFIYGLIVGAVCFGGNLAAAQDDHEKKAGESLKKAMESGKKGNAKGVVRHAEEARKQLIEENRDHPYIHSSIHIYGENPKAEQDDATFEEIAKAIGEANKGNAKEAGEAARRAYIHLKERIRAR
jgi:hypothetical protein